MITCVPTNFPDNAYSIYECQPDVLSPDLSHDVPLPTKVFIAQGEEVVDHKGLRRKSS